MGELENPLPEVDQEEHPLRILSQENMTVVSTFTGMIVRCVSTRASYRSVRFGRFFGKSDF